MTQILLGFEINTVDLTIRFPEQKRAGASVLFDELFADFGSNTMRMITLQQIRGNIEHFKSTNTLWSYFTAPIDALLGCGDECNLWVVAANADFWIAFWPSVEVIRTIRKCEKKWALLFCGSLERLLPPEQRFACHEYPDRVVWMSGDATLETVAGVSWSDKQFFVFRAAPLVVPFRRNPSEEVIIGECELLVVLPIALLWGKEDIHSRILIVCADNMNVSEWLSGWRAKTGCSNRMLQSMIDYLIEEGVGIIPRYVRSGRNFSCDFLSRASDNDVLEWSKRMRMKRMELPAKWRKYCDHRMQREYSELGRHIDIMRVLREDGPDISACEWRPTAYTFVRACQQLHCKVFVHEPDHLGISTQMGKVVCWNQQHIDILLGMCWADHELSDFAYSVAQICPTSAVAITPQAFRGPSLFLMRWKECIFADSAAYGSVRNQIWRLYIWGQLDSNDLLLQPEYRSSCLLGKAYADAGYGIPKDEVGVTRAIPFEQESGLAVIVGNESGQRYSVTSHIPILNLSEIWSGEPKWPRKENGEEVSTKEKVVILGGHTNWPIFDGVCDTVEANSLLMSGPSSLMGRILYAVRKQQEKMEYETLFDTNSCSIAYEEVTGRAGGARKKYNDDWRTTKFGAGLLDLLGVEDGNGGSQETNPNEDSDVRSFFETKTQHIFGIGKLNDLLSGIAEGTRAGYISAWKHWFQFTQRTPEKRWITAISPMWGETLINWIIFETRIMGLQASTVRAKISGLRYWHLLSGYPDWGKWSGRYKQVLNSVAKKDVVLRNYPFNLELMSWIYRDFGHPITEDTLGGDHYSSKFELCAAMTIGFFFLLRVSELGNLRMRDIRIGQENGISFLTLFLAGSKTDQYNRGDFKRLEKVGGLLCPLDALVRYLKVIQWGPSSNRKLFGLGLRDRLGSMMKSAAIANRIDPSRIGTHPLRGGGPMPCLRRDMI